MVIFSVIGLIFFSRSLDLLPNDVRVVVPLVDTAASSPARREVDAPSIGDVSLSLTEATDVKVPATLTVEYIVVSPAWVMILVAGRGSSRAALSSRESLFRGGVMSVSSRDAEIRDVGFASATETEDPAPAAVPLATALVLVACN